MRGPNYGPRGTLRGLDCFFNAAQTLDDTQRYRWKTTGIVLMPGVMCCRVRVTEPTTS